MRLMLGTPGKPELLVSVSNNYNPSNFAFDVINGAWEGHFTNGYITINSRYFGYCVPWTSLDKLEILCDNQDRLRFPDSKYMDVFHNFDNPDYIAPKHNIVEFGYDDDIPF